ncbi:MAG: lipase family protein [Candidatus Thermochlorobacter sp.]
MKKPLPPRTLAALRPPSYEYRYFQNWKSHRFNPDATTFNICNAWWLAEIALLAYADVEFIQKVFDETELHETGAKVKTFQKESLWCFVAYTDQTLLIAFRGTELQSFWDSVQDLITDFNFFPVSDGAGAKVHRGFLSSIESVWQELEAHVTALYLQKPRKIWLTGHSLGAALATLAADKLTRETALPVQGLYTFGSPRVGDLNFLQRFLTYPFSRNTYRIVLGEDIVPHAPPVRWFRHVGRLHFINERDEMVSVMPSYLSRHALKHALKALVKSLQPLSLKKISELEQSFLIPNFLADHAPLSYAIRTWNCYVQSLNQKPRKTIWRKMQPL